MKRRAVLLLIAMLIITGLAFNDTRVIESRAATIPVTIGSDDNSDNNSKSSSSSSDEATDDEREDAVNRLSRYLKNLNLVNSQDLTSEQLDKLKELCDSGRNAIAGNDDIRRAQLSDIESDTKKIMDDYIASCLKKVPQTTVEYLAVGSVYDIPIANHGEVMNVILPILNLGTEDLTNVIVTPVVSGNVKEFPFQISRGGFTQEIPFIPGSVNMDQAMAQRAELLWAFALRDDVLDGYYKIEFDLVYQRKGVAEKAKLYTYVRCVGAPGSGSVEDGENAKKSTPRIIVTGFSTDPGDVFAGSTFMLGINVKNASSRTAVTNIQFDLKAAEEGKDKDTLYYSFLPTSGSNTIYVPHLAPGEETELKIEMSAKADLVQKPYAIEMNMKYEDEDYNPFESVTSISVPVKQLSRVEYSTAEVVPDTISVGSQSNVMFSVYNTGKTILYNVKVAFDDPSVSGGDAFLGKLESGATGNVDVMLTGEEANIEGKIKGTISYENDAGVITETEFTIPLVIEEEFMPDYDPMADMEGMEDGFDEPDKKTPIIIGIVVFIVAAVIIVLVVRKIKKKKRSD